MKKSKPKSQYSFYRADTKKKINQDNYPNGDDVVRRECDVCNHVWLDIFINVIERAECPACIGRIVNPERIYTYKLENREVRVQDYEGQALDFILSKGIKAYELVVRSERILPIINLFSKGSVHFPDIYIPNKNLILDVRNTKTFAGDKSNFYLCQERYFAALELDFGYRFLIMNSDGSRIKLNKNWCLMDYEEFITIKLKFY